MSAAKKNAPEKKRQHRQASPLPEEIPQDPAMDRRVRKTRRQLRQGLTKLMMEKNIQDITVRELTDLVDINRSTFYAHYKDIYQLLESIEQEMMAEFIEVVGRSSPCANAIEPLPMLLGVFEFVAQYSDMCLVLIGQNGDISFVNRLKEILKERCLKDWMRLFAGCPPYLYEYFYDFNVSGCMGILQRWLESGMRESPQEIARLSTRMILEGIRVMQTPWT